MFMYVSCNVSMAFEEMIERVCLTENSVQCPTLPHKSCWLDFRQQKFKMYSGHFNHSHFPQITNNCNHIFIWSRVVPKKIVCLWVLCHVCANENKRNMTQMQTPATEQVGFRSIYWNMKTRWLTGGELGQVEVINILLIMLQKRPDPEKHSFFLERDFCFCSDHRKPNSLYWSGGRNHSDEHPLNTHSI